MDGLSAPPGGVGGHSSRNGLSGRCRRFLGAAPTRVTYCTATVGITWMPIHPVRPTSLPQERELPAGLMSLWNVAKTMLASGRGSSRGTGLGRGADRKLGQPPVTKDEIREQPNSEKDSAASSQRSATRVHADETLPSRAETSGNRTCALVSLRDVASTGACPGVRHDPTPTGGAVGPAVRSAQTDLRPARWCSVGAGDRFEVVRLLGSGGTGLVFLARDRLLNRLVATKFARPDVDLPWAGVLARFAAEGRPPAKLNHENIVHIFDVGCGTSTPTWCSSTWKALP